MNDSKIALARTCLQASENGSMTFPQIVGALMQNGFESYAIDFRRAVAVYYGTDGDSVELPTHRVEAPVSAAFDEAGISAAIREAQQLVPGYTYKGFCRKVVDAGCASYVVSFSGRRAVYMGRTGETHVEHFPN